MPAATVSLSKAVIAKVAVPLVAVAGAATFAVASSQGATAASGPGTWIDSPLNGSTVTPGMVTVQAHASSETPVTSMTLFVDGTSAATTSTLEQRGNLSYAQIPWQAQLGTHQLWVQAGSMTSIVVTVNVSNAVAAPTVTTLPTTSAPPTSTEVIPPPATSAAPTTSRATTNRPTTTRPVPTTQAPPPPPPPPPPAAPTISRVVVAPPAFNIPGCGGPTQLTVTAEIGNATSATFEWVAGAKRGSGTMALLSGTTWRGLSGDLYSAQAPDGPVTVTVTAVGPGGTRQGSAPGTIGTCKP